MALLRYLEKTVIENQDVSAGQEIALPGLGNVEYVSLIVKVTTATDIQISVKVTEIIAIYDTWHIPKDDYRIIPFYPFGYDAWAVKFISDTTASIYIAAKT